MDVQCTPTVTPRKNGTRERERQSPSQHADCRSRRSALAMGHTYPLPLGDAPLLKLRTVTSTDRIECGVHRGLRLSPPRLTPSIAASTTDSGPRHQLRSRERCGRHLTPFDKGPSDAPAAALSGSAGLRRLYSGRQQSRAIAANQHEAPQNMQGFCYREIHTLRPYHD